MSTELTDPDLLYLEQLELWLVLRRIRGSCMKCDRVVSNPDLVDSLFPFMDNYYRAYDSQILRVIIEEEEEEDVQSTELMIQQLVTVFRFISKVVIQNQKFLYNNYPMIFESSPVMNIDFFRSEKYASFLPEQNIFYERLGLETPTRLWQKPPISWQIQVQYYTKRKLYSYAEQSQNHAERHFKSAGCDCDLQACRKK